MARLHIISLKDLAKINYRGSIKHPKSYYISNLNRFMILIICFILMFILCASSTGYYLKHVRTHFAQISTNVPMTKVVHHTLKGNHVYHIIFYNSECPHCQQVVPPAYLKNKISGYKIQYRDIQTPSNTNLANKLGGLNVPSERTIVYKNHHISTHFGQLNMLTHEREHVFLAVFCLALLLISYVIAYVII